VIFHSDEGDGPRRPGEGNSTVRITGEAPHRFIKKFGVG